MDQQRPGPVWGELDDATLLEYLRQALRHHEQPPAAAVELAKASFGLRRLDAELAALVADSLQATSGPRVRSLRAPRLLSFEAEGLAVEVEAVPAEPGWRIVGQLEPPGVAEVELRRVTGPSVVADVDEYGRFALDVAGPGPISLFCRRDGLPDVATAWVLLA